MQNQKAIPAPIAQAVDALLATCNTTLQELTAGPDHQPGQLLKVNDAAKRLQISVPTAWRLIRRGDLKPVYIGEGCTRIPESQIIALVEGER